MPRKFGQHFLKDEKILEQIAAASCGPHSHLAVEIGPGRGALTRHLLPRVDELHVIEVDPQMIAALTRDFAGEPKLQIHAGDVLETDLAQWGPAVIAGNLPYYITAPILRKFLDLGQDFSRAVFLVQWEVALRLLAVPGSRDYGFLTVVTQLVCDVELVCKVPPGAFSPPPKVDSAAVALRRKLSCPQDLEQVILLASRAFAHKRKNLRNNLRPFFGDRIDDLPEAGLRAEQISVEAFIDLARRLGSKAIQ